MRPKPLLALSVLAVASLVITAAAAAKPAATSFTTFELAATPPSASGPSTVCAYSLSPAVFPLPEAGLHVSCRTDAGATFTALADAYDGSDAGNGCRLASRAGNLAFDPSNGSYLYAVAACGTVADATNPNPTGLHVIVVAASTNGGQSFTDHVAYLDPDVTASFDHNFPNLAVDRGGNVYALGSADHHVYYAFSTNGASTCSGPFQVSTSGTNV